MWLILCHVVVSNVSVEMLEQEPFRKNFKTVASAPLSVDLMASPANVARLWHASCGLLVVLN